MVHNQLQSFEESNSQSHITTNKQIAHHTIRSKVIEPQIIVSTKQGSGRCFLNPWKSQKCPAIEFYCCCSQRL